MRIQKSAEQNAARIQKMKTVNALVEKLYKEAKDKMVKKLANDKGQYKELCKNLLIQVIKLDINIYRDLLSWWNQRL